MMLALAVINRWLFTILALICIPIISIPTPKVSRLYSFTGPLPRRSSSSRSSSADTLEYYYNNNPHIRPHHHQVVAVPARPLSNFVVSRLLLRRSLPLNHTSNPQKQTTRPPLPHSSAGPKSTTLLHLTKTLPATSTVHASPPALTPQKPPPQPAPPPIKTPPSSTSAIKSLQQSNPVRGYKPPHSGNTMSTGLTSLLGNFTQPLFVPPARDDPVPGTVAVRNQESVTVTSSLPAANTALVSNDGLSGPPASSTFVVERVVTSEPVLPNDNQNDVSYTSSSSGTTIPAANIILPTPPVPKPTPPVLNDTFGAPPVPDPSPPNSSSPPFIPNPTPPSSSSAPVLPTPPSSSSAPVLPTPSGSISLPFVPIPTPPTPSPPNISPTPSLNVPSPTLGFPLPTPPTSKPPNFGTATSVLPQQSSGVNPDSLLREESIDTPPVHVPQQAQRLSADETTLPNVVESIGNNLGSALGSNLDANLASVNDNNRAGAISPLNSASTPAVVNPSNNLGSSVSVPVGNDQPPPVSGGADSGVNSSVATNSSNSGATSTVMPIVASIGIIAIIAAVVGIAYTRKGRIPIAAAFKRNKSGENGPDNSVIRPGDQNVITIADDNEMFGNALPPLDPLRLSTNMSQMSPLSPPIPPFLVNPVRDSIPTSKTRTVSLNYRASRYVPATTIDSEEMQIPQLPSFASFDVNPRPPVDSLMYAGSDRSTTVVPQDLFSSLDSFDSAQNRKSRSSNFSFQPELAGAAIPDSTRPPSARRVAIPYHPQLEDELELNHSDWVLVEEVFMDNWAVGKNLSTNSVGAFPAVCLE